MPVLLTAATVPQKYVTPNPLPKLSGNVFDCSLLSKPILIFSQNTKLTMNVCQRFSA